MVDGTAESPATASPEKKKPGRKPKDPNATPKPRGRPSAAAKKAAEEAEKAKVAEEEAEAVEEVKKVKDQELKKLAEDANDVLSNGKKMVKSAGKLVVEVPKM